MAESTFPSPCSLWCGDCPYEKGFDVKKLFPTSNINLNRESPFSLNFSMKQNITG